MDTKVVKLFNEIRKMHSVDYPGEYDIYQLSKDASAEYLKTHDHLPTIEEINNVIDDYRKENGYGE